MRVTFVTPSLTAGGAERVLSIMANALVARGWELTILSTVGAGQVPFYPLHPSIQVQAAGGLPGAAPMPQKVRERLRLVQNLRQTLLKSRPQVVLSFQDTANVLTLLATVGTGLPVVVAEHTDPAQHQLSRMWHGLRRLTYPRARTLVVLSEAARAWFPAAIQGKTVVLPNPVLPPPGPRASLRPVAGRYRLLGMGHLNENKNFATLIQAFAQVASRHPDWELTIHGEGPERDALQALIASLNLEGRVFLPGLTRDAYGALQAGSLFAMCSLYEGFPMVLCEAMASGLPVLAWDCPSGPRQIIRHETDGLLVPYQDLPALVQALDRLMGSAEERQRLADRAVEVLERFHLDRLMDQWEGLLRGEILTGA